MIQKIKKIKNIGNYENYEASGDVTLKKINLIYAENGAGKTTLTRILQSLAVNDPTIILQHKRIGSATQPEVCIKDESGQLEFNGSNWNRNITNIAVFDTYFVSENIYTGFEISSDHRKHLYKFILGDIGIDIAKKIERVKKMIDTKNTEITEISNKIITHTKTSDVKTVCDIKSTPDIDKHIEEKKKELIIAQNNNVFLNHIQLNLLPDIPYKLNCDELKKVFSSTVESIGKEYLNIVQKHIKELKDNNIEDSSKWIYNGFVYLSESGKNMCPFCGSNTQGLQLINGYNQYFSDEFKMALENAKKQKIQLDRINIESYISMLNFAYQQFKETYKFWSNYVTEGDLTSPTFDYNTEELQTSFNNLKASVDHKTKNPVDPLNPSVIDEWESKSRDLTDKIQLINDFITSYNTKITALKSGQRIEEEVNIELKELELKKNRFEKPLKDFCNSYAILKRHHTKLQEINRTLQQQQKNTSNNIFNQYGQKINYYLNDVFETKFCISGIKDGGIKGRAKEADLDYTLNYNNIPIEQEGENNTSFKNVLSEGDKNTIAFSFFLAKLTTKADLSNQIVVFDDPLTSLDQNRRNTTIHQLELLYQQSEQLIVLSHNLHFLIELNSRTLINNKDKKSLQIINANGTSSIQEYQIKREWIDNYHRALISMEDFLNKPSVDNQENAINSIRISLETFIKLKFCCFVPNPDQTFGTIVHNLQDSSCTFINKDKDSIIDQLNQLVSISWRVHHGSVEERESYKEVNLTSNEAQKYIRMTLKLLNYEL